MLTDIAYYLIFSAYILFTVALRAAETEAWRRRRDGRPAEAGAGRIGGILLIIGVLHGLNIVLMPVLGRLFSLNRRLSLPTTIAPSEREAIDREVVDDDRPSGRP